MDQKNLGELQTYVKNFVDERNWQTPASDILIHMVEELGEVARNVLKMKNYGGQHTPDSGNNMPEELADVFYLLLKLANEYNIDLVEAFSKKMEKNLKRFPPDSIKFSTLNTKQLQECSAELSLRIPTELKR